MTGMNFWGFTPKARQWRLGRGWGDISRANRILRGVTFPEPTEYSGGVTFPEPTGYSGGVGLPEPHVRDCVGVLVSVWNPTEKVLEPFVSLSFRHSNSSPKKKKRRVLSVFLS